jgi:hypothetical protein
MGLDFFRRQRRWLLLIGGLVGLATLTKRWQRTVPRSHWAPRAP